MSSPNRAALEDVVLQREAEDQNEDMLQLLITGNFADCEVRVGRHTWKTHQAILATRSRWFRDALVSDAGSPNRRKIIIITGWTKHEVQAILDFIYGGRMNAMALFPYHSTFETVMKLHMLADYFQLTRLRSLALKARDCIAHSMCFSLSRADGRGDIDYHPGLMSAIRSLYVGDYANNPVIIAAFRPTFLQIAITGVHAFAKDSEFQRLLREVGAFASDWSLLLMQGIGWRGKPDLGRPPIDENGVEQDWICSECEREVGEMGAALEYFGWIDYGSTEKVYCKECFIAPTLEQWQMEDMKNEQDEEVEYDSHDDANEEDGAPEQSVVEDGQDHKRQVHESDERFAEASVQGKPQMADRENEVITISDDDDDILEIIEVKKPKSKKRKKNRKVKRERQDHHSKRPKMEGSG